MVHFRVAAMSTMAPDVRGATGIPFSLRYRCRKGEIPSGNGGRHP